MKEEFKETVNSLLEVNLSIKAILDTKIFGESDEVFLNFQSKTEKLLTKKDILIGNLQELKQRSPSEFSALKQKEFNEIWNKIKKLEAENLEEMQKLQNSISEEMVGNKQHARVISSYKSTKEVQPRLVDDSL